jgi:hypothetical protein
MKKTYDIVKEEQVIATVTDPLSWLYNNTDLSIEQICHGQFESYQLIEKE